MYAVVAFLGRPIVIGGEMRIALSEIKGMSKRVRNQMDPQKLEELSKSIEELGLLQPVKVRKNGNGYTLVFGHRRVMAARAAGLKEIEAIVENVPDNKLLTQALAENVIREDMAAIDIAKALQAIKDETGATNDEIGRRLGWTEGHVRHILDLLETNIRKVAESYPGTIDERDVREARAGTAGDPVLAARVLQKSAKEELSSSQTRKVAEVVKRAHDFGGQKAVQRVLAQKADDILRGYEPAPKAKARPVVREAKGKVLFQWVKDTRVILAEEGLRAVSAAVSAIARSDEDRGGGRAVLKALRRQTVQVLKQIDDVLG